MGESFAIAGLRRKRSRIAGEIEKAEHALARLRDDLANVDAVLRLFSPQTNPELIAAIRPCSHRSLFFKRGEQPRLCLSALREAGKPMPTRRVADYAMAAKGLDQAERREQAIIVTQVRQCLLRLERHGRIRKIMTGPDAWWELAG
jgi:hypothetical protein